MKSWVVWRSNGSLVFIQLWYSVSWIIEMLLFSTLSRRSEDTQTRLQLVLTSRSDRLISVSLQKHIEHMNTWPGTRLSCSLHWCPSPTGHSAATRRFHMNKGHSLICFVCVLIADPRSLRYEETIIIALSTVFVLAVVAVAAFFGYRMMHGELPWCHTETEQRTFNMQVCFWKFQLM